VSTPIYLLFPNSEQNISLLSGHGDKESITFYLNVIQGSMKIFLRELGNEWNVIKN
jgi:hypothetical protein